MPTRSPSLRVTFFCLQPQNDQISSTWTRFAVTLRISRVMVFGAGFANAHQQPKDSAFRYARHADRRTNRATFDQRRDDRDFLFDADYVCHNSTIRQRFRIVNRKSDNERFYCGFLGFRPTRFRSFTRAALALFVGHGFKRRLPPILPPLAPISRMTC